MRILQLVQKPQRRGAEIFAFQLSQELRRQGHEVRTAYLYPCRGRAALELGKQDFVLAGQENHLWEKFPGFQPALLQKLGRLVAQFQPDVVQVNGARTVKYGAFMRRFSKIPRWVLIYRNIGDPKNWVNGWHYRLFYTKLVMPQLNGVVGVSQTTLTNLLDFYNLAIPIISIPGGVDPVALRPSRPVEMVRQNLATPPDAPVMLFVGSLTPEKRLDRLLRIVCRVRAQQPNLRLWVVGDGPLRPALEQQVEMLALTDTVQFLGMRADIANYLNTATVLALTSDTEGIPGVILEAGFLGLPVVATRVGGVPECVCEGKTGLLVDPDDEQGFSQAVLTLLQNPRRRQAMGEQARAWITENYLMEKIGRRYLEFYEQVLGAQPTTERRIKSL